MLRSQAAETAAIAWAETALPTATTCATKTVVSSPAWFFYSCKNDRAASLRARRLTPPPADLGVEPFLTLSSLSSSSTPL